MAIFKKTGAQDIEPRLPRTHTPSWELRDKSSAQGPEGDNTPRRVSLGVIVARVFFGLAVLGLLACVAGIALIWIYARDMSTFMVVLLIIGAIVTGVIAHALADKAL